MYQTGVDIGQIGTAAGREMKRVCVIISRVSDRTQLIQINDHTFFIFQNKRIDDFHIRFLKLNKTKNIKNNSNFYQKNI